MTLGRRITGGFLVALLLLGLAMALAVYNALELRASSRWVTQTAQVNEELGRLSLLLAEAENSTRAFLMSGQERELARYHLARSQLPPLVGQLRQQLREPEAGQLLDRVEALATLRLEQLGRVAATRRQEGEAAAVRLAESREVQASRQEMRQALAELQALEARVLDQRTALLERHTRRTLAAVGGLFVLALLLLLGGSALLTRSITWRIRQLVRAAERLGAGDLHARIPPMGADELGELAGAFNQMAERRLEAERTRDEVLAAEQRLSRLLEDIAYASVSVADQSLTAEDGLSRVLQSVVDQARRVIGADYAALGIGTDATRSFLPWVFSGMAPEVAERLGHAPRAVGTLGWVARQGHTLRLEDVRTSPLFRGLPAGHPPVGAFLGVPIRYEGRSVGNLYLGNAPQRGAFSEHDQRAIELLAAHAGVVVENARLYHAVTQERASIRLLSEASASLVASLDVEGTMRSMLHMGIPGLAQVTLLHLLDTRPEMVVLAGVGAESPGAERRALAEARARELSGRLFPALAEGRTLRVEDVEAPGEDGAVSASYLGVLRALGVRSALIVPLVARGRTQGALTFGSREPARYGPEEAEVCVELGRRAALALDNARLYAEAQRAVRAREEVLAVVSHDLRSPLNSLTLSAEMLLRGAPEGPAGEKVRRTAENLKRVVTGMLRMMEDLLDAAAVESGRLTVVLARQPLRPAVDDVLALFHPIAQEKGIRLEAEVQEGLPEVLCDRDRLRQLLSNLVGNSLRFTPPGGSITLRARREGERVRLEVRDTGSGIAAEDLPHLFDRYWQVRRAHRGGAGLGLYISRGIAEAHGSRLEVESQPGRGTTFHFTVPVAPQQEGTPPGAAR